MVWVKRFFYLVYLALFLVIGIFANVVYRFADSFTDSKTSVRDVFRTVVDPKSQFPNQDRFTVLLIGQDYNHTKNGAIYTKHSRADTIMMLSVDLNTKSVRACSVPRDTYVTAPDGKSGKINGTFARGGVELLKSTLERMFDVDIDYHVIIKPTAVRNIVDSVGGVDVETIDDMNYDDNWGGLHVHLPKGRISIDGAEAEGYVRFREVNRYKAGPHGKMIPLKGVKGSKEEGDLRRTARQQELIHSLMVSAKSTRNLMRIDKIIDQGFKEIKTDLSRVQLLALGNLFGRSTGKRMIGGTVPGQDDMSTGAYYFKIDEKRAQAMVDWLIKGNDSAMKSVIRIEVANGTPQKGLAKVVADRLDGLGYNATTAGNSKPTSSTRVVYFKSSYMEIAKELQKSLSGGDVVKGSRRYIDLGPEIRIEVGEDMMTETVPSKTSQKGNRRETDR